MNQKDLDTYSREMGVSSKRFNEEVDEMKSDKKKGYRISGGIFYIHGKDKKDLQLNNKIRC